MSTGSIVDPHDKMRARDVSKVAKGEQAPKPAHEFGTVSPPPSPQSTSPPPSPQSTSPPPPQKIANKEIAQKLEEDSNVTPQTRHCYESYVEYHKCIKENGRNARNVTSSQGNTGLYVPMNGLKDGMKREQWEPFL